MTLLLASASPARRRLLELAAIPHGVQVSGVDEEAITDPSPDVLVQKLAQAKAQAVVARLGTGETPAWGVLGCDSVLEFAGNIFGKPADAAEAITRWQQMAGRSGLLHTGHCLLGSQQQLATVTTTVHFAPLTQSEIEDYVATGEPLQCAGGFALEGRGGMVVEKLEGCYSNVIGLSLPLLRCWLSGVR